MSKAEKLKSITKKIDSLPTLPPVVNKLTSMVESPDVTAREVGKLIASDQVLGARVLRLVNSPFYGFPGRISSISHAIILLGFNVIKGVVLSASVFDIMEKSMVGLWEHSLGCAVATGAVARAVGMSDAEEIATAGLLHDIGKVIVRVSLTEDYDQIAAYVQQKNCPFCEAERLVLGVDHSEIGLWLAREWNLPERLAMPISYHHDPLSAPRYQDRVAAVHVADSIVRAFGVGSGGDPWVGHIDRRAWEILGLDEVDLNVLMQQIMLELEDVDRFSLG